MQKIQDFSGNTVPFLPASLTNSASIGWNITYFIFNPLSEQLERRVIKLNRVKKHYRTIPEFKAYATQMVMEINTKLSTGWNPLIQGEENGRNYMLLETVIERYLAEKTKDLSADTMRSYTSFCRIFLKWLDEYHPKCKCAQFNKVMTVEFLDYIYNDHTFDKPKLDDNGKRMHKPRTWRQRQQLPDEERVEKQTISANTYNNYVRNGRSLFSWMVEKCYMKENPFMGVPMKDKEKKKRTLVSAEQRDTIREYFMNKCPEFLIVAELVFNALIRPTEISRIKVGQVYLAQKVIRLDEEQTKTGYKRDCVLSDELIKILADVLAPGYPADYYLIGPGYKPGEHPITSKAYRKTWQTMREKTGLPETIQLYSLRDSGLTGLFDNGADANTVKGAADHHDLNITTKYCDHVDEKLVEKVRKYTPKF